MEHVGGPVKLKLDEGSNLTFEVKIEGATSPGITPSYRLVCEATNIGFTFYGTSNGDQVSFDVPVMKGLLKEGSYDARLEAVIDGKLLVPLEFEIAFKAPTSVTVEAIHRRSVIEKPQSTARAKLVSTGSLNSVKDDTSKGRHVIENMMPRVNTMPKDGALEDPQAKKPVRQQHDVSAKRVPTLREIYKDKKKPKA